MIRQIFARFQLLIVFLTFFWGLSAQPNEYQIPLENGWFIQSSEKVAQAGDVISKNSFKPNGWISANVPSTVLGTLADQGIYKDPFFARNLESISREPFKKSWWYRKAFKLTDKTSYQFAELVFEGINYRANVWFNGVKIASSDSVFGTFRQFNINITKQLQLGYNVLAVEVFPPKPGEFSIGWVDWAPRPNDENMGIFRPVTLKLSGAVSIDNIFVQSSIDLNTLETAALTITTELTNHTGSNVMAVIRGKVDSLDIVQRVDMEPFEKKEIVFNTRTHPVLNIYHPKLWWPYQMGNPYVYKLSMECNIGLHSSDKQFISFGIRDVSSYHNADGSIGYLVNGQKVTILGGGWGDDLFLRENAQNLENQVLLTRQMHLNTIRMEGYWGCSQRIYNLCDKYGILLMVGFSCHWEWPEYLGKQTDEFGGVKTEDDMNLVNSYLHDQVVMHRNHPCIFTWVTGSDDLPRPALAEKYIATLKEIDPNRLVLWSCKEYKDKMLGETGVKMVGPYDYVTPNYWYLSTKYDHPFGFNTETGPGAQIPSIETLKKIIPNDSLWPLNKIWEFHCGRLEFHNLDKFTIPLDNRYGKPSSFEEFALKSDVASYEAIRPMFESTVVHMPQTTGIIQWMLNGPWPRMIWQLYDYYLTPTSAFYGTMKACQPVNIIYNYGDGNIYVTNSLFKPQSNLFAEIKVLDVHSKIIFKRNIPFDLEGNESKKISDLVIPENIGSVYFVDLKIFQKDSSLKADNFYWLSSKKDVVDTSKCNWVSTPNLAYADFKELQKLPEAKVELKQTNKISGGRNVIQVSITNTSETIAFFLNLKLKGNKTNFIPMPVLWSDNLISLLPGESKVLEASCANGDLMGEEPVVTVTGWNVK